MADVNQEQLRRLARIGAVARFEQIRQDEAAGTAVSERMRKCWADRRKATK